MNNSTEVKQAWLPNAMEEITDEGYLYACNIFDAFIHICIGNEGNTTELIYL